MAASSAAVRIRYAKRVLGDFRTTPLSEIWRGLTGERAAWI